MLTVKQKENQLESTRNPKLKVLVSDVENAIERAAEFPIKVLYGGVWKWEDLPENLLSILREHLHLHGWKTKLETVPLSPPDSGENKFLVISNKEF